MPERAKRYTGRPGGRKPRPPGESARPTANDRGYTARWQRASKVYLANNPVCVECKRHGFDESATCVDHVTPHRGSQELFWDTGNWQALCTRCHNSKTGKGK